MAETYDDLDLYIQYDETEYKNNIKIVNQNSSDEKDNKSNKCNKINKSNKILLHIR